MSNFNKENILKIFTILSKFKGAFFNPEKPRYPLGLIRFICRMPVIFDLLSIILQLIDIRRLKFITGNEIYDDTKHPPSDKTSEHLEKVRSYNATVTKNKFITTTRRAENLYQILFSIRATDLENCKLLIIGPRNISELFIAWTYGFSWKNIEAIDLFSTNKKIKVMNMEAMSFADQVFDCVTMSNTLAYAKDVKKTLTEVSRVLKMGGNFAFGVTYSPNNERKKGESSSFITGLPQENINGLKIKEILSEVNLNIFTSISKDKINARNLRQTLHHIGCRKNKSKDEFLDKSFNSY